MPSTRCTTNVLTNGRGSCEPNCCKRLIFKPPPVVPDLFNSPVLMGLTTYADDVRVTSITTEPVHTLSRVTANNAALDNALEEMAQNTAKQEHSVFFAGQRARQHMAFLNGTGVLPGSTGPVARYLGPHLDIMGSIRPELERRRAAAFRTWTRFCPVWLAPFFPGVGGIHSVHKSGSSSFAPSWLRTLGPFRSWSRAKAQCQQKEGVGLP